MSPIKYNDKLQVWRDRYQTAMNQYKERENFQHYEDLYNGTNDVGGKKKAKVRWNIVAELIESQNDNTIPMPKVTPVNPTPKALRNARAIEGMIRAQLDRLPFEMINDNDERMTKIYGGSAYLVEWDNTITTHDTVGDISVRLIDALQFIPQGYVYETRYMDYLFLTFEDTKERIRERYGKDVTDEGVDSETSDASDSQDLVTQVVVYYKGDEGIGCFSWAGDTILIDEPNYFARKEEICAACGRTKPSEEDRCICGSDQWTKRDKNYEIITEDIIRSDGSIIPAISPAKDENGEIITEEVQVPVIDEMTGAPAIEYMLDETGQPVHDEYGQPVTVPKMRTIRQPVYENTKLPYYTPKNYPVIIRKNISTRNSALGISDCALIEDFQIGINKALTRLNEKVLKAGSVVYKSKKTNLKISDEVLKAIELQGPEEKAMLGTINLTVDITQELTYIDKLYYMAKSTLGVTDTYQGKEDKTAESGRAKEAQILQAQGRLQSKKVMKYAAYADLFRMMFEYMLAFSDEPRVFSTIDEDGKPVQQVFNRYDFLEQDEYGNWYYDDQYLFSVDTNSIDLQDKQFLLEDLRADFKLGAYGNPTDPESILAYWREKEIMGYPNASRNVRRWEQKVEEYKAQALQQPLFGGGNLEMPYLSDRNVP